MLSLVELIDLEEAKHVLHLDLSSDRHFLSLFPSSTYDEDAGTLVSLNSERERVFIVTQYSSLYSGLVAEFTEGQYRDVKVVAKGTFTAHDLMIRNYRCSSPQVDFSCIFGSSFALPVFLEVHLLCNIVYDLMMMMLFCLY